MAYMVGVNSNSFVVFMIYDTRLFFKKRWKYVMLFVKMDLSAEVMGK